MNEIVELLIHAFYVFFLIIYSSFKCLIQPLVPLKYRSKNVKDEIILITGAGNGIGKLMAKKFARLGARMVLVDIDKINNEKTANEIIIEGGNAKTFTCDLSKREEIYKLAEDIKKTIGNINILINNAGIVTGKKFLESSDSMIEKTFQVNTMSHFWLTKSFLPAMLDQNHGHVVTVSSIAGLYGSSGLIDYCSSKFATVGFDESLRNELLRLGKTGVKTTLVCPNVINTGMFNGYKASNLIPALEPDYVADKIVEAVLTDQKFLLMPRILYFIYTLKGILSNDVENYISMNIVKTNLAMDSFVGRKSE